MPNKKDTHVEESQEAFVGHAKLQPLHNTWFL